jgi:hypothetical protein
MELPLLFTCYHCYQQLVTMCSLLSLCIEILSEHFLEVKKFFPFNPTPRLFTLPIFHAKFFRIDYIFPLKVLSNEN